MSEPSDKELLSALGVEAEPEEKSPVGTREARIIAGFEDIMHFYRTNQRLPLHGESHDIFERTFAARLDRMKASAECKALLQDRDIHGFLTDTTNHSSTQDAELDDDLLLAELGVSVPEERDITKLRNVRSRAEAKAAEEYARRTPCLEFDKF